MPKTLTRYAVTFTLRQHGSAASTLAGVLDMLRYDGATVVDWAHNSGQYGDTWTLWLNAERPEFRRWASMGVHAVEVA